MNLKQMKFLDKYVGFFICVFITFLSRIFWSRRLKLKTAMKKPGRILFIKFWGLGSILLLTPAVKAMRKKYPDAHFVFLTLGRNRELCERLNLFDRILMVNVDAGWVKFFGTFLNSLLYLWRNRPDLTVDFEFFTRFSTLISFLSFAKIKVGYHAWETWRGDVHNIKVPFNRYWHIIDNFYNLVSYLGLPRQGDLKMVAPEIFPEDREFVDKLLGSRGVKGDFIVFNVNASDLIVERRWPYENFVRLGKMLIQNIGGISVVFIGTKAERDSVNKIVREIKNDFVVNLAGELSISQLAYLLKRSKMFVANDSGPLHLAVAMDVPTISFFGPETPVIYGPRGKIHRVFFKNLDCSPCVNIHDRKAVHCRWDRPKCMEAIKVDEVYSAIVEKLK